MKKRLVSLGLLLAMMMSMVSPVAAFAAETSAGSQENGTVQLYAEPEGKNASSSAEGSESVEPVETIEPPVDPVEPVEPPAKKQEQVITVEQSKYSVAYGAASITLAPQTNGDGVFSFASDAPDIVVVNKSGKMSFRGVGTARITITASETETYKEAQPVTVTVTVAKGKQSISGVSSSYAKLYKSKKTFTLKAKTSGDGAVTYTSSNTSVATVDKKSGKVTMKKLGVCTITVTAAATKKYNKATKKITVTLYKKPASLKRSKYYKKSKYYRRLVALKLTGSNRQNVLAIANSQMGYHEGNKTSQLGGTSSGSKNYTEYGYYYGLQGAWCAMFVNWCARENGTSTKVIPRYCAVMSYYSYYNKKGQRFYTWAKTKGGKGKYTPKAGDLIFFSDRLGGSTHHIGYVRSFKISGKKVTVTTLEGNTSNQAKIRTYTLTKGGKGKTGSRYIKGFASPKY